MCQGEAPVIIFHQSAFAADYQPSAHRFRWATLMRVLAVADIRRRVRFTFRIPRAER